MGKFQCSLEGCDAPTESHYCLKHRRHCSECGTEWSAAELLDGRCRECHRIDFAYAGCECGACSSDNGIRSGVDYAPMMVGQ